MIPGSIRFSLHIYRKYRPKRFCFYFPHFFIVVAALPHLQTGGVVTDNRIRATPTAQTRHVHAHNKFYNKFYTQHSIQYNTHVMKFAALLLATTTTDAFRLNRGLNRRLPSNAAGMLHNNAYQTCFDREFATAGVSFSFPSLLSIFCLPFFLSGVCWQQRNNATTAGRRIQGYSCLLADLADYMLYALPR